MDIGHNHMPLEERIFQDPSVSVEDVLAAVTSRIERANKTIIDELTKTAKTLSGNKDRIPETFTNAEVLTALDLLARIDDHANDVAETKDKVLTAAQEFLKNLTLLCKPLDASLSPLEKSLRTAIAPAMEKALDEHNAERTEGETRMNSLTLRSASGAKATLIDSQELEVIYPSNVPREFCVPDPKLLAEALKNGREVPGTAKKRKTTLRISTK